MKEKPKLDIPEALGLCKDCIENESKFVDDDTVIVCYCPHNFTGSIFQIDKGIWRLSNPISQDDFERLSLMQRAGIRASRQRHQKSKVERREKWKKQIKRK